MNFPKTDLRYFYEDLRANGWDAALARRKGTPEPDNRERSENEPRGGDTVTHVEDFNIEKASGTPAWSQQKSGCQRRGAMQ
jgi:hypothetical protein